jgi:hypothetical protein
MASIFTKKWMGLDNNVWLSMTVILVVSLVLVGYNYRLKPAEIACEPLNIFVNGLNNTEKVFYDTGDSITFRSNFTHDDDVEWDFGDGSKTVKGIAPVHIYQKEGLYTVLITLNGKCGYDKKLLVKPPEKLTIDGSGHVQDITGSTRGFIGDKMTFSSLVPASSYQWEIENNSNFPMLKGDSVQYTFRTPGKYILVMVPDGDRSRQIRKELNISRTVEQEKGLTTPKPLLVDRIKVPKDTSNSHQPVEEKVNEAPPPVKKTYKVVSNEILKTYLQAVVCGEKAAEEFDPYLCEGVNTPVIQNNKERKSFDAFCKEVKGRKIEIESVIAARDERNCIINLSVTIDPRGRLARNPCKN